MRSGTQLVSAPAGKQTCCGEKGYHGLEKWPWMLPDQASVLQGPAMVFVPEKAVISKN